MVAGSGRLESPWGSGGPPCLTRPSVSVSQAGKFSIIPTVINIGSGLALMGAVSISPALLAP
jgi:hypothetical protein